MENHPIVPGRQQEQEKPQGLLIVVLVWMCPLFLVWMLIFGVFALSVTPEDEPLLWWTLAPFPLVAAASLLLLFAGFQRHRKGWMVIAAVASTIAAFVPWAGAFLIDTSI